jgi:chromosome partitioning protein
MGIEKQIPHSRGYPKLMRGDMRYSGNFWLFDRFAKEFFDRLGLEEDA